MDYADDLYVFKTHLNKYKTVGIMDTTFTSAIQNNSMIIDHMESIKFYCLLSDSDQN